jgi:hypothetical protein
MSKQGYLEVGDSSPKFGPYQGGTTIYFPIINMTSSLNMEALYCQFSTLEDTKFKVINSTLGVCVVPPSNYTQIVRVSVKSRDPGTSV